MKNLLCCFLISFTFLKSNAQNITEHTGSLPQKLKVKIDSIFVKFNELDSPGFAIGIIKDTTILYRNGYGSANLDYNIPITPNSVFDIASVSKQFTAACIALLIMDKKLTLDTPVQKYVSELSKYRDTIRIEHLIYNTSGLTDYFKLPRKNAKSWLGFYYFDIDEAIRTSLSQDTLAFKPGDKWDYCNVNYMLLTKVVEKLSGMPFSEFIEERLFKPLGMNSTIVNDDITEIVKNRVTPYNERTPLYIDAYKKEGIKVKRKGKWIEHHRNSPHYGGSGVLSSVNDLLRWSENFFTKKFGGEKFYNLMHKTMKFKHEMDNQAFGLYFGEYKKRTFVAWEGATAGISSQLIRFPKQKIAIAVLSNLGSGKADEKAYKIADILIDAAIL